MSITLKTPVPHPRPDYGDWVRPSGCLPNGAKLETLVEEKSDTQADPWPGPTCDSMWVQKLKLQTLATQSRYEYKVYN